jgi:TPR repeat protein
MNNLAIQHIMQGRAAEAEHWFERAARGGNVDAMGNLGRLLRQEGRPGAAEPWLRSAAELGHEGAAAMLSEPRGDAS